VWLTQPETRVETESDFFISLGRNSLKRLNSKR
jgi:hypothetical protein